jgi:hypothetical protein
MRELIDYAYFRLARDDRLDIHLFKHDVTVRDSLAGNYFQLAYLRLGIGPAVSLDEAYRNVITLLAKKVRVFEHLVSLADTGRGSDINAQPGVLLLFQLGQQ